MHRTKIYFPVIILSLSDSDYPTVPIKFGYTGSWRRVITPIHTDTTVYAVYTATGSGGGGGGGEIIIPTQPTSPGEIMSTQKFINYSASLKYAARSCIRFSSNGEVRLPSCSMARNVDSGAAYSRSLKAFRPAPGVSCSSW